MTLHAQLAIACFVIAPIFLCWPGGDWLKKRNKRVGLPAPVAACVGTREEHYMRAEPPARSST